MFNRFLEFPTHQVAITPSDSDSLGNQGMIVRCGTAGNISVEDNFGTAIVYTVSAGEILPVLVNKVLSTGTTVTGIVGVY